MRKQHKSGSQESGGNGPYPKATTQSLTTPDSAQNSTPWSRELTLPQGGSSPWWDKIYSSSWGYCFPLGLCHTEESVLFKKDDVCGMQELISIGILVVVSSAFHRDTDSSLLRLSSASNKSEWLFKQILCIGTLKGLLCF